MTDQGSYLLAITPTARRHLTDHLPEAVAAAAYEFIVGPLLESPHLVGKRLRPRRRVIRGRKSPPSPRARRRPQKVLSSHSTVSTGALSWA